jgi:hypothetical protein
MTLTVGKTICESPRDYTADLILWTWLRLGRRNNLSGSCPEFYLATCIIIGVHTVHSRFQLPRIIHGSHGS